MRSKTLERREHFLDIAEQLFDQQGYEQVSMAQISASAGGSRATLYSYFPKKEELYLEVFRRMANRAVASLREQYAQESDAKAALSALGKMMLTLLLSSRLLTARALLIGSRLESRSKEAEEPSDKQPYQYAFEETDHFFEQLCDKGLLCGGSPRILSRHFRGMLDSEAMMYQLFCPQSAELEEQDLIVERVVTAFLRAYGKQQAQI
ncbi:TetR/AcrR family transcriptional regulator [Pokkaliibacter sp. CJK22405]|uniref:TetR/AcrR family transcriptional regulator n=1 Tax=Pokkaliibacter sp. CJK22405 TaxID=3384615 RepID=UPI0039847717